jgi:PAS domain S-box-containing protein
MASGLLLGELETGLLFLMSVTAIWGFAYANANGFQFMNIERNPYIIARNLTLNYFLSAVAVYLMIRTLRRSFSRGRVEIRERQRTESILRQQAGYQNALHNTTLDIINRLELHPLLESILTRACELVDAQDGLIELVLPDESALKLEVGIGLPSPHVGHLTLKNHGITGRVWANGKTQIVTNYSNWEHRDLDMASEFDAIVGLPLKSGRKVIGVLALLHVVKGKQFTSDQVSLLERFASLVSLAIQNARLYEEAQSELQERRLIQSALRDSEEKFRKVFESSPVAICITTLEEGRLLEANNAYWDLTGYDPNFAIGSNAEELNMWDVPEERLEFVQKLKHNQSVYNPDDYFHHTDGSLKHVTSFYESIQIGNEACILSMFYDMSAQKQTIQALEQSETRARALLEAIPDMILELTLDGLITNMIPPKGMETSVPSSQFIDRQIHDVFSESAAILTMLAIERAIDGSQLNVFEFEGNVGNDVRTMEARVFANTTNTVLMMLRDVTQRRWIETERERLINELEIKNKESETLRNSLASIVGTLEFSEIIQLILDQIQLVVPYDSASVWRVEGTVQRFVAGRNLPKEFRNTTIEFETNETNSALPILNGEVPYILNGNVQEELPDFQAPPHNYVNSWLAVPLKTKGNIIGLIALDGNQKNQFNEHHSELAVIFANQVAIALENASLFANLQSELEQRRDLIERLTKINAEAETLRESTVIVAASLEISETVQRILEQIQRVVQYDSASVWLYQEDQAVMIGSRSLPAGAEKPGYYAPSEQEPDHPFFTNSDTPYIVLHDVQENYSQFRDEPKNYIHGWMAIPLRARGSLIGFIALDSRNSGQYQESDALLALSYSNQVAIALENARLFSDLQTELWKRRKLIEELETKNIESETLRESVAIVAATLDRDDAIDLILEQLERVVPYDSASVQLVSGNMLEIVSSKGYPIGDDKADNTFEINEDEPAYLVLRNEKPYVLFDDIQPLFPAFQEPPHNRIHAWMAVPLVVKGRVLGIIALDGYQKEKFTERHAQLAMTYASQVAIALDNARLFSDLQSELAFRQNLISELEAKNAELERFTYTVSHDLKSPLFTIRGFLGYLEEDAMAGNYERMKSDIQRITDATNKMQQLLNELLELSRVGRITNESETIPFEELTREAVELVQGHIMEHGVSVHIDADMPDVFGDRQRLREVVQNLVDNAAKFMGDQLEPRIEIGQDGEEDGMPIFHVRDNGIGIPTEHHERVFGLFNKLDVRSDGTGIGLALVKRIIEYHGGRIWVESGMGLGTTFYFTLPAG